MKKFDVQAVVATAIGAAIFFVLFRFLAIPTWIPNTTISIAYGFLALLAAVYGWLPAALAAFLGHWFTDLSAGGIIWYSWLAGSVVLGLGLGVTFLGSQIHRGVFNRAVQIRFVVGALISNALAWLLVAPWLDNVIYGEEWGKVFLQGQTAFWTNSIATVVLGYLLIALYARTRTQSGSLSEK